MVLTRSLLACTRRVVHTSFVRFAASLAPTYDIRDVEAKWQKRWAAESREMQSTPTKSQSSSSSDKLYVLSMFPYPSGRLHMGHVRVYAISELLATLARMKGKEVIHPMGWDAFGLPAENAAIDRNIHPAQWTDQNIEQMREQLLQLGFRFDWHREVATHKPNYYKWTQWLFLQLYKAGLAYQEEAYVNWDPVDQTVLANEQVDGNGCAWRSGAVVERKKLKQWFLKMTNYSQELLDGLEGLDWPKKVKTMQENWIGKSTGVQLSLSVHGADNGQVHTVSVFTTRIETLCGASFVALSSDHELVAAATGAVPSTHKDSVKSFQQSLRKERDDFTSGVSTGLHAMNPLTGQKLPIYLAGYVLGDYGTGALIGVPSENQNDRKFAKAHDLPLIVVAEGKKTKKLINSGQFDGLTIEEGRQKMTEFAAEKGFGTAATQFRLRDWLISRQRYWGTPIPVVHCSQCTEPVPVPEDQLPVVLPTNVDLDGRGSPLASVSDWVNTTCPKCGSPARRETDTMDTFMDSAWYYMRFIDPHNDKQIFDTDIAHAKLPVDIYIGGIEHAILHLLFARFIYHFCHNQRMVPGKEPFLYLLTQGLVLGKTHLTPGSERYLKPDEIEEKENGDIIERSTGSSVITRWEKMSKSKYNGVDPLDIVETFGADVVRLFLLQLAPPHMQIHWELQSIVGLQRWARRLWNLILSLSEAREKHLSGAVKPSDESNIAEAKKLRTLMYHCVTKANIAMTRHAFNWAIAEMMVLSNHLGERSEVDMVLPCFEDALRLLSTMLGPFAPHLAEELWEALNTITNERQGTRALQQKWPQREDYLHLATDTISIQINGKQMGVFEMPAACLYNTEETLRLARESDVGKELLAGKTFARAFVSNSGLNALFMDK